MNSQTQHDLGKLLLRLALGVTIFLHGLTKLEGGLDQIVRIVEAQGFPGFVAYGVLAGEVLAPLLVIAGLYARIGAILIAINMLFALGLVHGGDIGRLNETGGWAIELQVMFLCTAIAIALLGPGRYAFNPR
ncbi:DoxX family protein [Vulcaniibacterium tengchongense]|uniref:Putative oxidoreductase n=1 Tax=Vulcaniibacterium tengchongense TaxID=1273429 RepID=A0A3N4VC03_9GAMM|nr:DoxX family protein [Vulcaniibacterium tengchongense]RPE77221.1 putative oxidoreductase [Vulcaniibacterium tengchongense]